VGEPLKLVLALADAVVLPDMLGVTLLVTAGDGVPVPVDVGVAPVVTLLLPDADGVPVTDGDTVADGLPDGLAVRLTVPVGVGD